MVQSIPTSQNRTLARLSQLLKVLRETPEADALIEAISPYLKREMGYSFAWFGIYDEGSDCLIGYEAFTPAEKRLMHRERVALEPGSILEQVFVQRRPLSLANLGEERTAGKWQTIARTIGLQGTLAFPIYCYDRCYGVALLGRQTWGMSPSHDEIAVLSMVLGQMATALNQRADSQQAKRKKRPAEPLLRLLDELRNLPTLEVRLKRLVDETHQFIGSSRTSLYWFSPSNRRFDQRFVRHAHANEASDKAVHITVEDCPSLYQSLNGDRILSISDTSSALQADISSYLQSHLKLRSLLATPLRGNDGLLGFFAAEGLAPRLWAEEEKQYLQGISQLATLLAPTDKVEAAISQGKADQSLIDSLGQAVRSEQSWQDSLRDTAHQLFERLSIDRLILLEYDEGSGNFPLLLQYQQGKRKGITAPLPALSELDWQLLNENPTGLALEDWPNDLRLMGWKEALGGSNVQSLMLCPTASGTAQEGIVIVTREQAYSWTKSEQDLLHRVAQQLSLVMHQRAIVQQVKQLENLHQGLQWGLTAMHQEHHPDRLDWVACQSIGRLLSVPLIALFSWSPKDGLGTLMATSNQDSNWSLPQGLTVDSLTDPLMQELLQADNIVVTHPESLSPASQDWLKLPHLDQVILFPLRTHPGEVPQGVVLAAVEKRRHWSPESLNFANTLVVQLSGSRRTVRQLAQQDDRQLQLQQLNWYKQYCSDRFAGTLQRDLKRIQENHAADPACQHMEYLLDMMADVFQNEREGLQTRLQTIPLTRFLKQVKERIDGQVSQQQLWCQFHGTDVKQVQLKGDILKLEGIVHEILRAACDRCLMGGRIDVWCRLQPDNLIELTVTDNGIFDPQLLTALQPSADPSDPLVHSLLEDGTGLNLSLVQRLSEQLGSSLDFLPLEDGRNMSRLLIPQG